MEHAWDRLKRYIKSRDVYTDNNPEELRTAIIEEWSDFPRD